MIREEKKYRWIKIVGNIHELIFEENNIAETEIDGKKICIVKTADGIKACSTKCPHAGGDMAKGKLDKKGNIICPVHGYIFNTDNGRDINGEGYFLKMYPVKISEEGVFVGIEHANS
ncbi:MAG: Rieske 2Fe-2S domain-containing protein [Bacteroidota bacterium]|nr:Rieske 2Fe-2S domain-containing protein [Bacteroidota bacterium]